MRVIRGIYNANDAIDVFLFLLDCDYSFSSLENEILQFSRDYYLTHEKIPTLDYTFQDFKRKQRSDILEVLDEIKTDPEYTLSDIKDFVLKSDAALKDQRLSEVLKNANGIAKYGETIKGKELTGRNDAVDYLTKELDDLKSSKLVDKKAGRLKIESPKFVDQYDYLKAHPHLRYGLTTGHDSIDNHIGGGRRGELHLMMGYTGHGKSLYAINYLYNVCTVLRRDSVYYTLEMPQDFVIANLCAIHSASERFDQIRPFDPLDKEEIMNQVLNPENDKFFRLVMRDLETNPNHGTLVVRYPGDDFKLSYMKEDMKELRKDGLDLEMLVVDHPELIKAEKNMRFNGTSEAMNAIMKDLKQITMTWDNGRGIFTFCPYQASRKGYEDAVKAEGRYSLNGLSYSNEAGRSADSVQSIWNEREKGLPQVWIDQLKFRRGGLHKRTELSVLWKSSYMVENVQDSTPLIDPLDFDI